MISRRWTIRARLTALYGSLFVLVGALLLGITYLLLHQALLNQQIDATILAVPAEGVPAVAARDFAPQGIAAPGANDPAGAGEAVGGEALRLAQSVQADFRERTLDSLVRQGAATLGGVAVVGIWLSWVVAGRTLRPIQQITATARRVADRNLHERIGLTGPRDELRQLADTFDDMLSRLDAVFDAQRRFVANASHELRTPLAINRTLLEVAMGRPDAPPQLRTVGETLLEVNARHEKLIDGLLTLARSEQRVVDPVPVDLADVVTQVIELSRPAADRAEVTWTVVAEPVVLSGDPVLLERLVQNLVSNAVAYNVNGGSVEVTCRLASAQASGSGRARLVVANTGPVIAGYEVPGIFEPFRRLTDRVGSARGSGLGLSIVRSVAQVHGGDVTASAQPSGGLRVEVTLPT